jgi:hypothetical protein
MLAGHPVRQSDHKVNAGAFDFILDGCGRKRVVGHGTSGKKLRSIVQRFKRSRSERFRAFKRLKSLTGSRFSRQFFI